MSFLHRLFMGGYYPVHIESIRLIKSNKNFKAVMKALSCLDVVMSDRVKEEYWDSITDEHVLILQQNHP